VLIDAVRGALRFDYQVLEAVQSEAKIVYS
jgi:hypothetical protein